MFASSSQNSNPHFVRYSELLEDYAKMIAKSFGSTSPNDVSEVAAFRKDRPSHFHSLDSASQLRIVSDLETQVRVLKGAMSDGVDPYDDRQTAWWALRDFGYRPGFDTFSKIAEGDVIEIYNRDHKQIFRSLNFFRCLSYSLDEIHSFQWWELYERSPEISEKLIEVVASLIAGTYGQRLHYAPIHWVDERFSERLFRTQIEPMMVSPLSYVDGSKEVGGYLHSFRVLQTRKTESA